MYRPGVPGSRCSSRACSARDRFSDCSVDIQDRRDSKAVRETSEGRHVYRLRHGTRANDSDANNVVHRFETRSVKGCTGFTNEARWWAEPAARRPPAEGSSVFIVSPFRDRRWPRKETYHRSKSMPSKN